MSDYKLELARLTPTVSHLAENISLSEAKILLRNLRDTVSYLERRVAREDTRKHLLSTETVVQCTAEAVSAS